MTSPWRPRTLILQHEEPTPPGLMTDWLAEQSADVETLRIDEVEPTAHAREYDLIVSLGSEFAAFDDSILFVPREVRLYEEAIEAGTPILGLCFGGQMLARVLGSRLFRSEQAEIGWLPVRTYDPELVSTGPWFQWHFDSFTPPPGSKLVAETDAAPQAFVAGRSMGLQFHPEVTPEIMDDWVRAYPHELEAEGVDPQGLLDETRRRAAQSRQTTWLLLNSFRDRVAVGRPTRGRTR
ncbi:MAG: aminotransferase [Candidatus Dormibacteraeota bacterium]|nr:aminotransferase [Candidatus Dormibacteraeota bacterium]